MIRALLAIAAGATLGAWLRWALSLWLPTRGGIALGTLAANLIGGYAVGVAVGLITALPQLAPEWRLFLVTGLLGGLTTFSAFSAETVVLLDRGQYGAAFATVTLHLIGSLALTAAGFASARLLLRI